MTGMKWHIFWNRRNINIFFGASTHFGSWQDVYWSN